MQHLCDAKVAHFPYTCILPIQIHALTWEKELLYIRVTLLVPSHLVQRITVEMQRVTLHQFWAQLTCMTNHPFFPYFVFLWGF